MERLFSYGTLQQENVQRANFGRVLEGERAVLQGYVLSEVKIEDKGVIAKSGKQYHPILVRTGNQTDEVTGHCYWLSTEELKQADSYEVAEYTRIKAKTKDGQACWIYAASKEQKMQSN